MILGPARECRGCSHFFADEVTELPEGGAPPQARNGWLIEGMCRACTRATVPCSGCKKARPFHRFELPLPAHSSAAECLDCRKNRDDTNLPDGYVHPDNPAPRDARDAARVTQEAAKRCKVTGCGATILRGEEHCFFCAGNVRNVLPNECVPGAVSAEFVNLLQRTPVQYMRKINAHLALLRITLASPQDKYGLIDFPSCIGLTGGLRVVPKFTDPMCEVPGLPVAFATSEEGADISAAQNNTGVPLRYLREWRKLYVRENAFGASFREEVERAESRTGDLIIGERLRVRIETRTGAPTRGVVGIYNDFQPAAQYGHDFTMYPTGAGVSLNEKKKNAKKVLQSPALEMALFPLLFWGGGGWSGFDGRSRRACTRKKYCRQLYEKMRGTWWDLVGGQLRQEW